MQLNVNGIDGYSCHAFADLASAEVYWRALETGVTQPFARHSWARACAATMEEGNSWSPLILVFLKGESPCMVLPLQVQQGWLLRRAHWFCAALNDYNTAIIAPDIDDITAARLAAAAFSALRKPPWRIDAIHLLRQPVEPTFPCPPPIGRLAETAEHGSHVLALHTDWEGLFAGLRSAKSRRRLREKQKALAKLGPVSLRALRRPKERAAAARQIMAWKSQQLDERGNRNPFEDGSAQLRHALMAALDDTSTGMRVYALFAGGKFVAGMIAFAGRHSFSMVVTAYDPQAGAKTSPGTTLLLKTMELAARAGIAHYDHLYGDEPYKSDWSSHRISMQHGFEPLSIMGWADCLATIGRVKVKKWIMRQPALLAAIYRLRRWTRMLAERNRPSKPPPGATHRLNVASGK